MKKITLLLCLGLLGCSGSDNPQTSQKSGFEFQPVDLTTKVPRVDIHNDDAILKSAGVLVKKISLGNDTENKPKKIYEFGDSRLGAQVELSQSEMVLSWVTLKDTEEQKAKSLESIKIAQRVARAIFGDEGGKFVDETIQTGKGQQTTINGHKILMTDCVGVCLMHIER
ncbi:hypothetical protein [Acinetobacter sp. TUM15071]|uniref:hypothetical protein n=1 Tax=Acinetobacter sp. TUM15071 TaxID=2609135 RepID=UPI00124F56C3|nr:hypothetical protein [Acinetobacter sp. TUM15071]